MTPSPPVSAGSSAGGAALALLESPARRAIVDLLANLPTVPDRAGRLPGLTATELAERVSLHVTTVRFHLDLLVRGGLLESDFRAGQVGRPRKVYRFQPASVAVANPAQAYQALAELLVESWAVTEDGHPMSPEAAGRRWAESHAVHEAVDEVPAGSAGAWLGKVGRTVDLLGRWGYTPELRTTDQGRTAELTLVDCPFLALAESAPEVVCGVHKGLLHGAMDAVGEPDTEVTLRPFVGPRRCLATLTTRAVFTTPSSDPPHPEETTP